jgi:membrane-bound serine protease (ClpP class)
MMRAMRRILRLTLALVVVGVAWSGAAASDVVHFRVEDTIQPASQRFIERALAEADILGAELVVMELDTPGGLLDATREITSAITTSAVPVAVFVTPGGARAASAGFFILISADVAAMAPGTNTGSAHPVGGQGENLPEDVRAKATQDAAAMVRALAEQRGRNLGRAVEAVEESTSFTAEEALKEGLIDLIAGDLDDLLEQLGGREIVRFDDATQTLDLDSPVVIRIEPTFADRLFSVLANPNVAYLLLALGALGLYVEITHPGGILPGIVGLVFLLLGLYSISVLPVSWAGVALIFMALVLFLLEVKVTSYGLLTVGGLICFVLGSLMLFEAPIPDMRVSLGVILPTALVVAGVTGFLLSRVVRAHRRQVLTGKEGLVGEVGKTLSELAPDGKVLVHGEYWDARSVGGAIAAGTPVRVLAVGQRRIDVEPAVVAGEGSE